MANSKDLLHNMHYRWTWSLGMWLLARCGRAPLGSGGTDLASAARRAESGSEIHLLQAKKSGPSEKKTRKKHRGMSSFSPAPINGHMKSSTWVVVCFSSPGFVETPNKAAPVDCASILRIAILLAWKLHNRLQIRHLWFFINQKRHKKNFGGFQFSAFYAPPANEKGGFLSLLPQKKGVKHTTLQWTHTRRGRSSHPPGDRQTSPLPPKMWK